MDGPVDPPNIDEAPEPLDEPLQPRRWVDQYLLRKIDHAFPYATPRQLFEFLKLLGIEQQSIAQQLGVSNTTVSFWATHQREIPRRYRPGLRVWAGVAWRHAFTRELKRVTPQSTRAVLEHAFATFTGPLAAWADEVLNDATHGAVQALATTHRLATALERLPLTTRDVAEIHQLRDTLNRELDRIIAMEGAPNPEGDSSDA